jgi:2-epi-valiolone-7-phosphate 1-reductase
VCGKRVSSYGTNCVVDRYRVLRRVDDSVRADWNHVPADAGPGIWLRVLRAGICGTDPQILRGVRDDQAKILGHEGVAALMGSQHVESSQMARGPRWDGGCAILNPVNAVDQDQILGHSYDGLFGQAVLAPAVSVIPADVRLPVDLGPLAEPVATIMYGWRLIETCGRLRTLGIWGGGTAAALAALIAGLNGVEAHVFHRRPERLSWLSRRGALGSAETHVLPGGDRQNSPPRLDAAFLCVPREGAAAALEQALRLVRDDGWIDLFGGFKGGDTCSCLPGVDLGQIRRGNVCGQVTLGGVPVRPDGTGRVWLTGHRGTSPGQLHAAQQLLIDSPGYFGPVISDVISLDRAVTFIPDMLCQERPIEYLKVIIDPTMPGSVRDPDLAFTIAEMDDQT